MSMAELVAIGAPELPEGYFYRIRLTHITAGYFISVRRPRRFLGSEELSCTVVYPSHFDNGGEAIVDGCRRAYEIWQESDEARERCGEASQYAGDHDPRGGR